jgi:hypothetical protein
MLLAAPPGIPPSELFTSFFLLVGTMGIGDFFQHERGTSTNQLQYLIEPHFNSP